MSEQAPAGWYPDGSGSERYWDGSAWTDQLRTPASALALPPAPVTLDVADEQPASAGMWSKFGSSVKKVAADRKAARAEEVRAHQERAVAAGPMVTSGVFGFSTIELYEGGYVRVAEAREGYARTAEITKNTPFEKLRSITFGGSEADAARTAEVAPGSPLEGAVMQAMSGLVKGGKLLSKGTAIGVAASGINQLAANAARKSDLVIATDVAIHTLTNQQHNGMFKVSKKEHDAVARALVEAGNTVLGISAEPEQISEPEVVAVAAMQAAAPSLSDRLRELSELHREGILSDDEFAGAKGKLLSGL
ncbi:DUF2510 domain-containing protein [Microbacterium murale]|uniref:DUF2510 domain-containing protein n=1 Tax=Microbacterium murale TaxID=1081040 RepID=A0ABQ1RJZ5_9MICO|nr:DUF2510 domain-containing protein [Microbacterium murale]GGD69494.1 hypothetical protein GCM10007269_10760 [Microbacterium murale]